MLSLVKRGPMQSITRSVRAYFAPVDRVTSTPTYFDPAQYTAFDLAAPPPPWIYAGAVTDLTRTSLTRYESLASGSKGAASSQVRAALAASVEFRFASWGRLQLALACGSQVMNVLEESGTPVPAPSGGIANAPIATLSGSTASEIFVGANAVAGFAVGDVIAVDIDYAGQTGFVGTGIAAAYVKNAAQVNSNGDYIRRVTFNVGRVRQKTASSLLLGQSLPGGAPLPGAKVQKVRAFAEREGGGFFQEWSALFVADSETASRTFLHYPRVQSAKSGTEDRAPLADAFDAWSLPVKLIALPTTDSNDNEQVLCYRSLVPAPGAAIL